MAENNLNTIYNNIHVQHGYGPYNTTFNEETQADEEGWDNKVIPRGEIIYCHSGNSNGVIYVGNGKNSVKNLPNTHKFISYQDVLELKITGEDAEMTMQNIVDDLYNNTNDIAILKQDSLRYSNFYTNTFATIQNGKHFITITKAIKEKGYYISWENKDHSCKLILNLTDEQDVSKLQTSIEIEIPQNILDLELFKDKIKIGDKLTIDLRENEEGALGLITFTTQENIYTQAEIIPMHIKYLDGSEEDLHLVNLKEG